MSGECTVRLLRRSTRQLGLNKIKAQEDKDRAASKSSEGLEIRVTEGKGRGIFTTRSFSHKECIVEYTGELLAWEAAKVREEQYDLDPEKFGSFMYFFSFQNKKFCIDATEEDNSLGRLVNHSVSGNMKSKLLNIDEKPVLVLYASREISTGEELLYDYGDRDRKTIELLPWLAQ